MIKTQLNDSVTYTFELQAGDTPEPIKQDKLGDRVVQTFGSFGGSTIYVEGSLDGENWFTLHDPNGLTITFTSAGGKAILENTPYIRPRVSGGDPTTKLAVIVSVRKN